MKSLLDHLKSRLFTRRRQNLFPSKVGYNIAQYCLVTAVGIGKEGKRNLAGVISYLFGRQLENYGELCELNTCKRLKGARPSPR